MYVKVTQFDLDILTSTEIMKKKKNKNAVTISQRHQTFTQQVKDD